MNTNLLRAIAILLFIGALFVGWFGYQMSKSEAAAVAAPPKIVNVPQVVVNRDAKAGERLNELDLRIEQVPQFNSAGFASTTPVVGRVLNQNIAANTAVLSSSLQQLGPAAQLLKSGERAVAVKIDEVAGVGGYIKPGDFVDVLLFANDDRDMKRRSISQVVLSNLRVISFGETIQEVNKTDDSSTQTPISTSLNPAQSKPQDKPSSATRSAVLAVKESDATRLMLAASIGQLRLALRGEEPLASSALADDSAQLNPVPQANQYDSHFIQNDELLKAPTEKVQNATSSNTTTVKHKKSTQAAQSSRITVHSGDKTELVTVKNIAAKGTK
ncbi:Flp pilus assembly protein CpaB [Methylotenera versatilis]|uniref:Flp pilus assembly protein CpaB n=1 Tax=Methylotenera versatilis TaxID=1055487 RepID=UPI0006470D95|nr:Flp pilus assembly protein CpaB [Methylotenera versatilis]